MCVKSPHSFEFAAVLRRPLSISFFFVLLFSTEAFGQFFNITLEGPPTLTGASGNFSVFPTTADYTTSLIVLANFGELGPANPNGSVLLRVPVIIRANGSYNVTAQITSAFFSIDPNAVQQSDIAFSVTNLRPAGNGLLANICSNNTISSPFNNDAQPLGGNPRIYYASTLADLSLLPTVLISGPRLSSVVGLLPNNGYRFDLYFRVVPQFFAPSSSSFSLLISIGPSLGEIKCVP